MTMEGLAGLPGSDASEAPVGLSKADIERLVATAVSDAMTSAQAKFEERAKGFQRVLAGRDLELTKLREQNEELKTAGYTEDERAQYLADKLSRENEELRQQLELQKLGSEFGDELPLYQQLLQASTAREQMELIRTMRAAQAPEAPAAPAAPEAPAVPDVDHNNPQRVQPADAFVLPDGTPLTDQMADQILRSVSRQAEVTQAGQPGY